MLNETIALKDIVERNNVKKEGLFLSLLNLLGSGIDNLVLPNKIANTLRSINYKTQTMKQS